MRWVLFVCFKFVRKVCRKPGSVLLVVQTGTTLPRRSDNHLSRPYIAIRLQQPTRTRLRLRLQLRGCGVLSVLLQMGFTRNVVTYAPRGLLHHGSTLTCTGIKPAIGGPFLWHYPSARADWTLSSILPCGARTFLSRQQGRQRLSVKLSVASLSIQGIIEKFNPECESVQESFI